MFSLATGSGHTSTFFYIIFLSHISYFLCVFPIRYPFYSLAFPVLFLSFLCPPFLPILGTVYI